MKRILVAAIPFLTAAVLVAGPAAATANKVTCAQIHSELASGKTPAQVAKDLKISQKELNRCNGKVASAKKHGMPPTSSQPAN